MRYGVKVSGQDLRDIRVKPPDKPGQLQAAVVIPQQMGLGVDVGHLEQPAILTVH